MALKLLRAPNKFDVLTGLLSGLLLYASFPPVDFWPAAYVALVPLLWLAVKDPKKALIPAYIAGAIFFVLGLAWVRHATTAGMLILGLSLAFYVVAFVAISGTLRRRLRLPLGLLAPLVWVTMETIRSNVLSGFPYLLLGHTQIHNLKMMQILDITGVYGVSFILVSFNGFLADLLLLRKKEPVAAATASGAIAVASLVGAILYGSHRLDSIETTTGPVMCLAQPNIAQDIKNAPTFEEANRTVSEYVWLTGKSLNEARKTYGPDTMPLVIWPESALPGFYNIESNWSGRVKSRLNVIMDGFGLKNMLIGMNCFGDPENQKIMLNSALFFSGNSSTYKQYDKMHLVPFGEYVPLSKLLFFVKSIVPYEESFVPGDQYKLFAYQEHPFGVVICYEDVFPGLVRGFVKRGAEFIVNISNEGWFYESAEAEQHLASARCRAIENHRSVVRGTNSGVSCFISPTGKLEKVLEKNGKAKMIEGWLVGRVTLRKGGPTFYTTYGDVFALVCIAAVVLAGVIAIRTRRSEK